MVTIFLTSSTRGLHLVVKQPFVGQWLMTKGGAILQVRGLYFKDNLSMDLYPTLGWAIPQLKGLYFKNDPTTGLYLTLSCVKGPIF